jgi:hypothetical protein
MDHRMYTDRTHPLPIPVSAESIGNIKTLRFQTPKYQIINRKIHLLENLHLSEPTEEENTQ